MLSPLTSLRPQDGMPVLNTPNQTVSFFEFWPAKIFYLPLIFYVLFLMLRYRSITLPSLANPSFAGGGFCGESKADILSLLSGHVPDWSVDFITHIKSPTDDIAIQTAAILQKMSIHDLCLPVVAKPDLGCRGAGVRLIRQHEELYNYVQDFPASETIILQRFVDYEGEAGVFYIRHPNEQKGHIFSLTLKYFPYVFGDGQTTLKNLILQDPRAGRVPHLYLKRLADHLQWVPPQGQAVRLVFSGSHSKGAIFRDGQSFITNEMRNAFDLLSQKIPNFYFGRFDVRFDKINNLQNGVGFKIIEVNGAGAEATHIWDCKTSLLQAWKTLIQQYKWLFVIGHENRKRGYQPIGLRNFYNMYKREKNLIPLYPMTQ